MPIASACLMVPSRSEWYRSGTSLGSVSARRKVHEVCTSLRLQMRQISPSCQLDRNADTLPARCASIPSIVAGGDACATMASLFTRSPLIHRLHAQTYTALFVYFQDFDTHQVALL